MLAPMSWSQGISGNSAVTSGGNEDGGTFGIGIAADVRQKYRFDLKYVGVLRRLLEVPAQRLGTPTDPARPAPWT